MRSASGVWPDSGRGLELGVGEVAVELLPASDRGSVEPAFVEVVGESVEQASVAEATEMDHRRRLSGGADPCECEEYLLVGAIEDVVLAGGRCPDLDRVGAEERFDVFVWVLDDDPYAAAVGGAFSDQLDDPRPRCEGGDDDLDPLDGSEEHLGEAGCGGVGGTPVARDHVSGRVLGRLARLGRGRFGNGVGPEVVLGRVQRPGDPGAVPRIWDPAPEPPLHGLDIDPDDVGELLETEARTA